MSRRRPAPAGVGSPRPAAALEDPPDRGRRVEDASLAFERGDVVKSHQVPLALFDRGVWLVSEESSYFEVQCKWAGKVAGVTLEAGEAEAQVELTGTQSEALLKYAWGQSPPLVRAHLCKEQCDQKRTRPDLVHLRSFKQLAEEAAKTWETNLVGADGSEAFRHAEAQWRENAGGRGEHRWVSSDSTGSRKKKKKKEEKRKDAKKENKKANVKKLGGKTVARKSLTYPFEETGHGKGGRQEKLLRVGARRMASPDIAKEKRMEEREKDSRVRSGERDSPVKGSISPGAGEANAGCDFSVNQKTLAGSQGKESERPVRLKSSFHPADGVAATAPARNFCTGDEFRRDSSADTSHFLGVGQAAAKNDEQQEFLGMVGFGEVGTWLQGRMDDFLSTLCKVKPSGKVFPLPSSLATLSQMFPSESPQCVALLRNLVLSLNSLNGEGLVELGPPSQFQVKILENLVEDCQRVLRWSDRSAPVSWEEFFRVRGIDYKGDEILSAQSIRWENVAPALPDEVGGVPLEQVVELGSLEYVKNFSKYLLDPEDQVYTKPPKVMVAPEHWENLCGKLLQKGVFAKIHEDDIYRVQGKPVLNGLFGVSKHEFAGDFEVMRIIMNLIPANRLCRGLDGDIATLPTWSSMSPLCLMPHEDLVISSEDVRCFFYIFKLPVKWHQLMAFNRPLPPALGGDRPGRWFPCSAVLPMGFKNSVSLAQHIHRFIARRALVRSGLGSELEARKDKTFSSGNPLFRIYLDNFDELMKVSKGVAQAIAGSVSPLVSSLREEYSLLGIPRHPKKSVSAHRRAEVQGAIIEGEEGIAFPKPEKALRYALLAQQLLDSDACSQKQMQVVGGGLVYLAMFRRPLLGSLNSIWRFILSFEHYPPIIRLPIPKEVKMELARFLGLIPLAFMDFRSKVSPLVTASDASKSGGGVTASTRVTPAGCVAAQCPVRGDLVEPAEVMQVVTIGLFDGIGALRAAVDALGWNIIGHITVEKDDAAARVVESRFPNTIRVHDVTEISEEMVSSWALKFSQAALVLIGAGPPCQGVSGLNAARKGALRDARSNLFVHVSRVRSLVRQSFPWAQVRTVMESVGSMDKGDQRIMSEDFGDIPWLIDSKGVSLARRPRLYWVDWELIGGDGSTMESNNQGDRMVLLEASVKQEHFLLPGWQKNSAEPLPTFTTSRPREVPGYKPAGLQQCTVDDKDRWVQDKFRFPPYQYRACHCLVNRQGALRLPSAEEREVIMGFPRNYTVMCMGKQFQGSTAHTDCRLSLIGNSWNVTVVSWILSQLGSLLGLNPPLSVQQVVDRTSPGCCKDFQTFLQRPLMRPGRKLVGHSNELKVVSKLLTLVSMKGEDLLLQASSEDQVKYHRLRASVPANLWRWKTITGWKWKDGSEHINVLEMRAVLTSLRWRIEKQKITKSKFVHMLDSLVCLHSLSRGRSSSRKLKRSLLRINALLLASHCHPVWTYVHTKDNPADAPSRRPRKRKWGHAQKGS